MVCGVAAGAAVLIEVHLRSLYALVLSAALSPPIRSGKLRTYKDVFL